MSRVLYSVKPSPSAIRVHPESTHHSAHNMTQCLRINQRKASLQARIKEYDVMVQDVCKQRPFSNQCVFAIECLAEINKEYHDLCNAYPSDPLLQLCMDEPDDVQCRMYDV